MKKKHIFIVMVIILVCLCICGLVACNHAHTYSEEWTSDETYHWHAATCEHTNKVKDKAKHDFGTSKRCICGKLNPTGTTGLTYEFIPYIESYIISDIGTTTDTDIVIGSLYSGKPVVGINSFAFSKCSSLTSISIPDSIKFIGSSAFDSCISLTSIYYGGDIASWCDIRGLDNLMTPNRTLYINGKELVGKLIIPDGVTSINNSAFKGCSRLTDLIISDSVTNINDSAFSGCSRVTSITIGNSVKSIDTSAFEDCSSLTNLTIGNSVTSICENAFRACSSLMSIMLPDSVKSIGGSAFENCSRLKTVVIPDSVTYISWMAFNECPIESATIPASAIVDIPKSRLKTLIITSGTDIGDRAFNNCYNLTNITICDSVTSIGEKAFYRSGIENIYYTGDIAGWCSISGIENIMRYSNPNKKLYIGGEEISGKLIIPDGVTSIADFSFFNCSNLTGVTVPNSVTNIGRFAFADCYKLVEVYNLSSLNIVLGSYENGYIGYYAKIIHNSLNEDSITYIKENGYIFCEDENDIYLIGYDGNDTELILPDIGGGKSYKINDYAFYNCSNLTSVTIPDSVTNIGSGAFYDCRNIDSIYYMGDIAGWCGISGIENLMYYSKSNKKIYIGGEEIKGELIIPNSVTSIPRYAFNGCSGLTSVTIPNSVISIGESAFSGCSSLSCITIPFVGATSDKTNYTHFGYIFGAYSYENNSKFVPSSLKTVIISGGKSIASKAFSDCSDLTSVTISDSVTSIGFSAFSDCSGLTSIIIPDGVISIGESAFRNCSSLTDVTIGNSVTSIYPYAFEDCSNLTSVTMGNSIINIGHSAFSGCDNLQYNTYDNAQYLGNKSNPYLVLIIPVRKDIISCNITDNTKVIYANAFNDCSNLTNITIPDSVISIGESAFSDCSNIDNVYYSGDIAGWCGISGIGNLMYYGKLNKKIYIDGKEIKGELTIPDSVTSIPNYAFRGCSGLTSVTIPNNVTSIGIAAFYGCSSLSSITIPFVGATKDGTNNTNFGYIFGTSKYSSNSEYVPNSLKTVIINGGKSIDTNAFRGCSSITSITISDSIINIGGSAFSGCSNIENVYYSGDIAGWCGISGIGNLMYYGKLNKKIYIDGKEIKGELTIPDSVTSIPNYAFRGCSGLTSVTIPNNVTSIGIAAFYGCSSLSSITIPFVGATKDGTKNTNFGYIFGASSSSENSKYVPTSLQEVVITGGKSIDINAFRGCSSITSITIPSSIISIGGDAFSICSKLSKVYYKGTSAEWSNISIGSSGNSYLTNATRYYYSELEPTDTDNKYWHYAEDGVTIVEW